MMAAQDVESYEVLILGGGKGGKTLAQKLGHAGRKVLLIEKSRDMVGGSCINVACIPTKAFITAARNFSDCQNASYFGIAAGDVKVDWLKVRARVEELVHNLRAFNLNNIEKTPNLDFLIGEGRFCAARTIAIALEDGSTRKFTADTIVINTGARPFLPDTPGLKEWALTSESIQTIDRLPEHLIVMGGSYIGLEFAQLFNTFGVKVTVIERGENIVSREDSDVSQAMAEMLTASGLNILTGTKVLSVNKTGEEVSLEIENKGKKDTITGSHLLVALGRIPNTEKLELPLSDVGVDKRGFIKVDEKLQTSCSGIMALGDVNGGPQFTHISFDDYRIALDQIVGGATRTTTDRQVPFTLFTDPELARIGLTEKEAIEKGLDVEVVKVPISVIPRAKVANQTNGFMKAIVDRSTKKILGCSIFGADAGNMIAVIQMAMLGDLPFNKVRDAVFSHPTMPEGFIDLFGAVKITDW